MELRENLKIRKKTVEDRARSQNLKMGDLSVIFFENLLKSYSIKSAYDAETCKELQH